MWLYRSFTWHADFSLKLWLQCSTPAVLKLFDTRTVSLECFSQTGAVVEMILRGFKHVTFIVLFIYYYCIVIIW